MFALIFILICGLLHAYVFWRASTAEPIQRFNTKGYPRYAGMISWLLFSLTIFFSHDSESPPAGIMESVGMIWIAFIFLQAAALLALDLVSGFGFILPHITRKLRGLLILIIVPLLSALALFQGMRPPEINRHQVYLAELPPELDGTVIVAISDLHLGAQLGDEWLAARVAQVLELDADLIVLLGDIFEGHGQSLDRFTPILARLSAPLGVWAVLGNHEFYGGVDQSLATFAQAGIRVARNEWATLAQGLSLAGVDDLTHAKRKGLAVDYVDQALENIPGSSVIFLSHSPWEAEKVKQAGVDLMLSGHTHGGQLWPFGYLTRFFYPMIGGKYQQGDLTIFVSRGTGTWGPRMRLWHPSEILHITLRAKTKIGINK